MCVTPKSEQEYSASQDSQGLLRFAGEIELNRFLTSLEALNAVWHKDAVAYLKEF